MIKNMDKFRVIRLYLILRKYEDDMTDEEKDYIHCFICDLTINDKKGYNALLNILKVGLKTTKFDDRINELLIKCINRGKEIRKLLEAQIWRKRWLIL